MHDAGVRLPLLLQPMVLRGIFARNRIVVSPMCQYKSEHGGPTDWHLVTCGKYAIGGAGIVFTEETAVEERGRKTHDVPAYFRTATSAPIAGLRISFAVGAQFRPFNSVMPAEKLE